MKIYHLGPEKEKNMKRRLFTIVLSVLLVASVFAGGSSESASSESGETVLTVLTTAVTQEPEGTLAKEYIAEFEAQHPGVHIECTGVPMNSALQRITTLAASGALPDLFVNVENIIGTLDEMGICEDLTPYLSEEEKSNIVDAVRESCTIDGRIIAYPWYSAPNALIFRTDWFEELGIEPPTTLDEMAAAAQKLTRDTNGDGTIDTYGFGLIGTNDDSGATRFVMIMRSFGARELYFEDGEWKTEVGSPESIQAFQFFSDLKNKYGVVPPGAIENSFNENVNLMAMEQIGMLIAGSNSVGKIFNANPDLRGKIGSVQMPSAVTTYTPVSMLGWSLNPESKNKDLAIEFVKFMSNKENSIKWVETTGRLPVMKDAIAESEYLADPLFDGFIAGVENMVQAPNAPFYAEVKTELGRTYQKLLLDPTLDVAAEVKACGAAIQNIIDNNT